MSTRATIEITDSDGTFYIYKHHDWYPEGTYPYFIEALHYAWDLPRYDAWDFSAALIKVMKLWSGSVYLTKNWEHHIDREYHYKISKHDDQLKIEESHFSYWKPRFTGAEYTLSARGELTLIKEINAPISQGS